MHCIGKDSIADVAEGSKSSKPGKGPVRGPNQLKEEGLDGAILATARQ